MKITSLVDNISHPPFLSEHGLSLHIVTQQGLRLLFDMGQGTLFLENALCSGIDITQTDHAVISHGHYDHGGGLSAFLQHNHKARVWVAERAFEPHYSQHVDEGMRYIGLSAELEHHPQVKVVQGTVRIATGITLFSDVKGRVCFPKGNRRLFGPTMTQHDDFCHEQNLIIEEGSIISLFAGCAHHGIVNILERCREVIGRYPTHVFAGMHLMKSSEHPLFLQELAHQLAMIPHCTYYTMHCTGLEAFTRLQQLLPGRIHYLACGDNVTLPLD